MIQFAYLGKGGQYSTYLHESVRRIHRIRTAEIVSRSPVMSGHLGRGPRLVAVHRSGVPLTTEGLRELLRSENIIFVVGDSAGLPESTLRQASAVVSVSSLPVEHGMEAAIVASQVEKLLVNG